MTKVKVILIALTVLALAGSYARISYLSGENSRLSNNQTALITNAQNDSIATRQLTLSNKELKLALEDEEGLNEALEKEMGIKTKQIKQLIKSSSKTRVEIHTELRDTTIYKTDTLYITRAFSWNNDWYKASGYIALHPNKQDSIHQTVTGIDTIYYVNADKKFRKFFISRWFEKPTVVTDVWNVNPHQDIKVIESINVK